MNVNQGFLFLWVINAKYRVGIEMMEAWGYSVVDEITWIKKTINERLAKSHGYYLQHAKVKNFNIIFFFLKAD